MKKRQRHTESNQEVRADNTEQIGTKAINAPKGCHCNDMNKRRQDAIPLEVEDAALPVASPSTRKKGYGAKGQDVKR